MTTVADHRSTFQELRPPLTEGDALLEADRCLECGVAYAEAPCVTASPANVDVPAFVAAIARGDRDRAAATIFAENLLGGTCARVCPVETLCEAACVLSHEGRRAIEIAGLQRFASSGRNSASPTSSDPRPPGSCRRSAGRSRRTGRRCSG